MHVHFTGICGTAMASVAVLAKQAGHVVTGSDVNIYPPMSDLLKMAGILPEPFSENPEPADCVVIGNAISRGNPELEAYLDKGQSIVSMPEFIRTHFLNGRQTICVTGTHGKTTTTALITWILKRADLNPGFLIGGAPNQFPSSAAGSGSYFVIEGDEYDSVFYDKRSKFLHYFPRILIINNLEYDHADIFPDMQALRNTFRLLIRMVPRNGLIIWNQDDPEVRGLMAYALCRKEGYGFSEEAQNRITDVSISAGKAVFRLNSKPFSVSLPGEYNVSNAAAAVLSARECGIPEQTISEALPEFTGVVRRNQSYSFGGIFVFDDFAHHPTAVRSVLQTKRAEYPGHRLLIVFDPRSNTSVRNIFQQEYLNALGLADVVWLRPLHRLETIPLSERLDTDRILSELNARGIRAELAPSVPDLIPVMLKELRSGDVLVLMSNGSMDGLNALLRKSLSELYG